MSKLKKWIKILIGRQLYIPRQVKIKTWTAGGEYGGFPVAVSDYSQKDEVIVYSFGIGEDLSFSENILKAYPNAKIFAFDPTPKAIRYVEGHALSKDDRFSFYPYGIAAADGTDAFYLPKNENYVSGSLIQHEGTSAERKIEVEMRTLETLMKERGHSHIDILKMDIEGSEFQVIPQILDSNCAFRQLCVETHHRFFPSGKNVIQLLQQQLNHKGYQLAAVSDGGEELLFVKSC